MMPLFSSSSMARGLRSMLTAAKSLSPVSPPSASVSGSNGGLFMLIPHANFSRYISKSRTKRLPLTTKRVGKGYYKGKGARKEGHINSKARFIVDPDMRTELVVPDLTGFKLKAYIAPTVKRNVREVNPNIA